MGGFVEPTNGTVSSRFKERIDFRLPVKRKKGD
jgi:hypothetical protein